MRPPSMTRRAELLPAKGWAVVAGLLQETDRPEYGKIEPLVVLRVPWNGIASPSHQCQRRVDERGDQEPAAQSHRQVRRWMNNAGCEPDQCGAETKKGKEEHYSKRGEEEELLCIVVGSRQRVPLKFKALTSVVLAECKEHHSAYCDSSSSSQEAVCCRRRADSELILDLVSNLFPHWSSAETRIRVSPV